MNFGQALESLKSGKLVTRPSWNGRDMHLYVEDMLSYTIPEGAFKGQRRKYAPCIVMFNAQQIHQPGWVPTQSDLLAEDWIELQ